MKTIILYIILTIISLNLTAQTYIHTENVDSLLFEYINIYRTFHKLPILKIDTTNRTVINNVLLNQTKDINKEFQHLKISDGEVYTNSLNIIVYNDRQNTFNIFVNKIFRIGVNKLTDDDLVALVTLFEWDQSKPHKAVLLNKDYKRIVPVVYYKTFERENVNINNYNNLIIEKYKHINKNSEYKKIKSLGLIQFFTTDLPTNKKQNWFNKIINIIF